MFRQEGDKLRRRELADYSLLELLIFYPETHHCWGNLLEPMLRDGEATCVTARISQEVSLGLKVIHMNAPPPVLVCQNRPESVLL
jgi:hypothetical protein